MASNRRVDVKRVATSKSGTFLEVSVGYRDGMEFHVLGKGGAGLLEAALRFSQKRMNVFVVQAQDPFNEPLNIMIERVLGRNGLTLPLEDEVCV